MPAVVDINSQPEDINEEAYNFEVPVAQKQKKAAILTRQEREAISKYRQQYISENSKVERFNIMHKKILVAIFNFWEGNGEGEAACREQTDRIKVSSYYPSFNICSKFHYDSADGQGIHT